VIAEPALVEKVMRYVEAKVARRGWDTCPPTLMVMRPSPSAGAPYQPVVIPMNLDHLPRGRGVYSDALLRMASTLIDSDDPARATGLIGGAVRDQAWRLLAELRGHRFAGMLLVAESWQRDAMDEQELAEYLRNESLGLADLPERGEAKTREVRNVWAVDTCGTTWWLHRVSGGQPELERYAWDEADTLTGRSATALRLMTITVCAGLPDDQHDIGRLAAYRDAMLADPDAAPWAPAV
jgi:hypothetical protein